MSQSPVVQEELVPISPSSFNPALTLAVPRLLPGELIARHVATLKHDDLLNCQWCGCAFKEGEEWMLDVYQQDGQSDTLLNISGKQVSFKKTVVLMVHAKECLGKTCGKAVSDFLEQVTISQRKNRNLASEEINETVWKQFRWAVRWISWHHQYLIEDPIQLTLGSKRPGLTEYNCKSFLLEMMKSHKFGETIHGVIAPMLLMDRAFIEGLFTRVYEFDLVYKGKFQPILQLKTAFDKATFNSVNEKTNVAAFVHTVLQTSYSSRHSDEQHLKLIVKVKPSGVIMNKLVLHYKALDELVTWVMLHRHIGMTRAGENQKQKKKIKSMSDDSSGDESEEINAESNELMKSLYASFEQGEQDLEKLIHQAGMLVAPGRKTGFTSISSVLFRPDGGHRTQITCCSNCYTASKAELPYYFFREDYSEADQPVFCYEGVMTGVMPILITSPKMLDEEMREAALTRVELPALTVLLSHHKLGAPFRTPKVD